MRGALVPITFAIATCTPFEPSTPSANDAATDALPAVDAGDPYRAGFCERQPATTFLCDDFDVGPLGFKWSEMAAINGGVLDLVPSSRSGPNALVARSSPATSGQAWAYLNKDLGKTTKRVVVGFDMRIEGRGLAPAQATGLLVDDSPQRYGLGLEIGSNGSLVVREATETTLIARHSFTRTPVPGEWARIVMDMDLVAPRLRVTVDGTPSVDAALAPTLIAGKRTLILGLDHFVDDGWRVAFDNVVCDVL
jgi:hypothetical protein